MRRANSEETRRVTGKVPRAGFYRTERTANEPEDTVADEKTDNPYTQTYVVQSGDSLSKIAQKYYGDPALYTKIFEANRDLLKDPNRISPGQKLRIP